MDRDILFITSVLILMLLFLYVFVDSNDKILGAKVWYDPKKLIAYELDGKETSQQVFDIYSFSHITHGILLYFVLHHFGFSDKTVVYSAVILEVLWELIENTQYIIDKYRSNEEYENYKGDSVVNVIGDTLFAIFGIYMTIEDPMIAIQYMVVSEIILYQWNANFLYLSIGSLLI